MTTETSQNAVIKAGLQALIATGVYNVTFIKTDGTLRTLKVSLNSDLLPATEAPASGAVTRASSDNVVTAFDLDALQWKSFKIESLVSLSQVFG